MFKRLAAAAIGAALLLPLAAGASVITTYYGDDDGFGVGQTSGNLTSPTVGHPGSGEDAGTDVRLIGPGFAAPAFAPTGGFASFTVPAGETIVAATLTMRAGSWVYSANPVGGPGTNVLKLDGASVNASFLSSFQTAFTDLIETKSFVLDASFLPLLADGNVSLLGSNLTEASGAGSFQIDFLSLTITTRPDTVPEPATLGLVGAALLGLARTRRRKAS